MARSENKKRILNTLVTLTLFSVFAKANSNKISLIQLSAGDVVNDINLDQFSSELLGNLFNGETAQKYVENRTIDYLKSHSYTTTYHCNETFHAGYYPDIKVEASKKVGFNDSKITASILGINDRYVDDKYLCVSFKECNVINEGSVLIDLNKVSDYPEDVKSWADQIGLAKDWREHETSYVSSIVTGDCVFQVLVYDSPEPNKVFDYMKETPIYTGRISTASHNQTLEDWTNNYVQKTGQSLRNLNFDNKTEIFKQFNNAAVIQLKLKLLPALSP